jgi:predicted DNA-binding transcriptional regulator YafY
VDPAARLLRLLSLLQSRPHWPGEELAERLDVTPRTVRRDVARLRGLGYPVDASAGLDGGYSLGAGGRLPPLLLDDDEAVAIAVGLRLATTAATVSGVEQSAVGALAKLDQVLPAVLRERIAALQASTIPLAAGREEPQVDADTLVTLATGCRRTEGIRFSYRDNAGTTSERSVEPYQIVHTGRRWYFVARDRDRQDWRTFRVDRITDAVLTGHRYTLEDPPDAAALVAEGTTVAAYAFEARILLHLPVSEARTRVPPTVGIIEAIGDDRSLLRIGADHSRFILLVASELDCEMEVLDPPELREAVRRVARRLSNSVKGRSSTGTGPGTVRPR